MEMCSFVATTVGGWFESVLGDCAACQGWKIHAGATKAHHTSQHAMTDVTQG